MSENWKPVVGYETRYEVSDNGRVKSLAREIVHSNRKSKTKEKILNQAQLKNGYKTVTLHRNDGGRKVYVHRLVLESFAGACPQGMETRHIDGNKENNALPNLTWGTSSENNLDIVRHGRHNHGSKRTCKYGHDKNPNNSAKYGKKNGYRVCLACTRARTYYRNHPELKISFQELADTYFMKISNGGKID